VIRDAATVFAAQRRRRRRRLLTRLGVTLGVLVLVVGTVWAVWFSPWFVVKTVTVTGNDTLDAQTVVAAAHIPVGTPLVRVDVAGATDRVRALPQVAGAEIVRHLTGAVQIRLTERTAVYVLTQAGRYQLVDATGTAYLPVDAPPAGLPLVRLPDVTTDAGARLLDDAAVIAANLPDAVRGQMVSLSAQTPDTFTIDLTNGAQILWGSAEDSPLKAQVITGLLAVKASYYDISSPSHPATR